MRLFRAIWFRLRSILQPAALNAEFDEELHFHIDRETQENIKRGMSADEARHTALAQFGGIERFKDGLRDEHGGRWLGDLSADVRHGVRLLRKNSLFSATVILTLALGIGATSTIFAIVNGVLLRPLPFPRSDRIVSLSEFSNGKDNGQVGGVAFDVWEKTAHSFSAMSVYGQSIAVLTGHGEPVEVTGGAATAGFFSVMSTSVALGRTFSADEMVKGGPRVVILSNTFWRSYFGSDSGVLNRTVIMNGLPRTIIGVMPAGFDFPRQAQYWVPLIVPRDPGTEYYFGIVARLRDGVSLETAARDLQLAAPQIDSLRGARSRGATPVVMQLHDRLFGSVRKPLSILLAAVVVLMLIACANVANLTLARSSTRQREFAVRLALGAGRWRLVRQLLVESSVLAFIGGAVGLLVPALLLGAFVKLSPSSVAGVTDIRVDGAVLVFTVGISLLSALLFGLAPALTGARSGTSSALSAGSNRSSATRSHRAVRAGLVIFEVSAALTLLTGAALLSTSFSRAMSVNPGFTSSNVYSASVNLPSARYPEDANELVFYQQVAEQLRGVPGIEVVSLSGARPLGGFTMSKKMARAAGEPETTDIAFTAVDANYGRAAGLHLIGGRFIDASDALGAPRAALLTKSAAEFFFPGQSAVGRLIPLVLNKGDEFRPVTIVGVVENVAQLSLDVAPMPQIFLSSAQRDDVPQHIVIRSTLPEASVRATVKSVVSRVDPLQPVNKFYVLGEELARSVAPRRFNSLLVNAFAALALVLALIGLYGLMANAVIARSRELGIRIALGAQSSSVLRLVMRQGAWLVFAGIAVGALVSLLASRTLSSLLYDVPAQDPTIFAGAAAALTFVALVACYIPARRATRVDPMSALRQD